MNTLVGGLCTTFAPDKVYISDILVVNICLSVYLFSESKQLLPDHQGLH